jgi:hypothetical protein
MRVKWSQCEWIWEWAEIRVRDDLRCRWNDLRVIWRWEWLHFRVSWDAGEMISVWMDLGVSWDESELISEWVEKRATWFEIKLGWEWDDLRVSWNEGQVISGWMKMRVGWAEGGMISQRMIWGWVKKKERKKERELRSGPYGLRVSEDEGELRWGWDDHRMTWDGLRWGDDLSLSGSESELKWERMIWDWVEMRVRWKLSVFEARLARRLRLHIFNFYFLKDASHESFVFKTWTFSFWGMSRTKASFSHLQLSLFEGCLARKLRFHIFNFQFSREKLRFHHLNFQFLRDVSHEMRFWEIGDAWNAAQNMQLGVDHGTIGPAL